MHQQVVRAVVDDVRSSFRHAPGLQRQVELGPNAVHGGRQEPAPGGPLDHARETALERVHAGAPSRAHSPPDAPLDRVRARDVHAGFAVAHQPRARRG